MYGLYGGIQGAVFILGAIGAITKEPALWLPTVIMGAILGIDLTWLATTNLALARESICYRSLFVTRNIPLADIVGAKLATGFRGYKPFQRLVLTVREGQGKREITINAGLFDRSETKRLVDAVNARLA